MLARALGLFSLAALCGCVSTPTFEAPRPASTDAVVLSPLDAEVWAWQVHVVAEVTARERVRECRIVIEKQNAERTLARDARSFALDLELNEGANEVQARCWLESGAVLRSAKRTYTGMLRDAPSARIVATATSAGLLLDASTSERGARSAAALVATSWFELRGADLPSAERIAVGHGERITIAWPADGEHVYEALVQDARSRSDRARAALRVVNRSLQLRGANEPPSGLSSTIAYGIYPPLYGAEPLRGVVSALDSLHALGVSALWLAPLADSLPGDFGYAVVSYFRVRPSYGSAADLRELVKAAHARGIEVWLDLVPNHTSTEHPYFQQAERAGRRSHYFDFYVRDASGAAQSYFGWKHLPNLSYDEPEVRRMMLAAGAFWIDRFGLDGFRVDAAWGVRERRPDFWPTFSQALRRVSPDAVLLAEASARDPYYREHGFDAAYDWTQQSGQWAWQDVWRDEPGLVRRLDAALAATAASVADPRYVLRFLNNNDTEARFITRHGEPMTRVATAALMTLPGIPCLYSFDEVGAEFAPYDPPHDFHAPKNDALREYHRRLIALRRTLRALQDGVLLVLDVDPAQELYVFLRYEPGRPSEAVLVALHFAPGRARAELELPGSLARSLPQALRDALDGSITARQGKTMSLELGPWQARILLRPR